MSRAIFILALCAPLAAWAVDKPSMAEPKAAYFTSSNEQVASLMDETERTYYEQMFDHAMFKTKPGQSHAWKSYASSGEIFPGPVVNGKNTVCRPYKESINAGGKIQTRLEGMACKRVGSEGWCRMPKNDMLSCAAEPPRDLAGKATRDAKGAADGVVDKVKGWWGR